MKRIERSVNGDPAFSGLSDDLLQSFLVLREQTLVESRVSERLFDGRVVPHNLVMLLALRLQEDLIIIHYFYLSALRYRNLEMALGKGIDMSSR